MTGRMHRRVMAFPVDQVPPTAWQIEYYTLVTRPRVSRRSQITVVRTIDRHTSAIKAFSS